MASYNSGKRRRSKLAAISLVILALVLLGAGGGFLWIRHSYNNGLKPVSEVSEVRRITIEPGSSPAEIGDQLQREGIIRSAQIFGLYVRRHQLTEQLKAGTFELSASWTVPEIVDQLVDGLEASDLLTIGPGLRLDQIRQRFITAGYDQAEVDRALDANTYANHPSLVDKPVEASLEGYIFPESYRVTSTTTAEEVVRASLDQLELVLTPETRQAIVKQGLTTHEAIILASIIEKEVSGYEDRRKVAQVMLKRYREGMALGADATYLYAAAVEGGEPFPSNPSLYNTRMHAGLPPGPISNVGKSSLEAVADPADTDYLFYVTGDDGVNHFTRTEAEHEAAISQYCSIACAPGYIAEEE